MQSYVFGFGLTYRLDKCTEEFKFCRTLHFHMDKYSPVTFKIKGCGHKKYQIIDYKVDTGDSGEFYLQKICSYLSLTQILLDDCCVLLCSHVQTGQTVSLYKLVLCSPLPTVHCE